MALCERRNLEYPTLDHENLCLSVVCGLGQRGGHAGASRKSTDTGNRKTRGALPVDLGPHTSQSQYSTVSYSSIRVLQLPAPARLRLRYQMMMILFSRIPID